MALTSARNIKNDLTHDQYTGFFTQAMYPVYDAARRDKGKLMPSSVPCHSANIFD